MAHLCHRGLGSKLGYVELGASHSYVDSQLARETPKVTLRSVTLTQGWGKTFIILTGQRNRRKHDPPLHIHPCLPSVILGLLVVFTGLKNFLEARVGDVTLALTPTISSERVQRSPFL